MRYVLLKIAVSFCFLYKFLLEKVLFIYPCIKLMQNALTWILLQAKWKAEQCDPVSKLYTPNLLACTFAQSPWKWICIISIHFSGVPQKILRTVFRIHDHCRNNGKLHWNRGFLFIKNKLAIWLYNILIPLVYWLYYFQVHLKKTFPLMYMLAMHFTVIHILSVYAASLNYIMEHI